MNEENENRPAGARDAVTDGWIPVSERLPPEELVVLVYTPDRGDGDGDRLDFDCIIEGGWNEHNNSYDHFMMVGGAHAAGPDSHSIGPSEDAPYTHWKEVTKPGQATQPAAPETTNSTEISSKLVVGNTAAPGMGDAIASWRASHSVDRISNGEIIDKIAGPAYGERLIQSLAAALAAQPAPVVGGDMAGVDQRARELFAAELERDGIEFLPGEIRKPNSMLTMFEDRAIRAIKAALLSARPGGDDSARIDWLESNEADLVTHRESENAAGEYSIWWNVVMDNGSVSGHPLGYARDAIDEAMRLAAKAHPAQAGGDSAAPLSSGAEGA